jgi:hypothetical protein
MKKLALTLICMVFLTGTVLAVSGETSSPADVVKLKWQGEFFHQASSK